MIFRLAGFLVFFKGIQSPLACQSFLGLFLLDLLGASVSLQESGCILSIEGLVFETRAQRQEWDNLRLWWWCRVLDDVDFELFRRIWGLWWGVVL